MDLKFFRQHKYLTTILIVVTCIFPDIAHFFLKRVPALQECRPCRRFSTFNTSHKLLDAFEGNWMPYKFIIIHKGSRRKMDEGCKDCLTAAPDNQ